MKRGSATPRRFSMGWTADNQILTCTGRGEAGEAGRARKGEDADQAEGARPPCFGQPAGPSGPLFSTSEIGLKSVKKGGARRARLFDLILLATTFALAITAKNPETPVTQGFPGFFERLVKFFSNLAKSPPRWYNSSCRETNIPKPGRGLFLHLPEGRISAHE